jgi:hypothetical protein
VTYPAIYDSLSGTIKETWPTVHDANTGPGPFSTLEVLPYSGPSPTNVVILIGVWIAIKSANPLVVPQVTGISGGGLTWHRYIGPLIDNATPGDPSGTGSLAGELWWAYSAAAVSPTTFTLSISPSLSYASNQGTAFTFGLMFVDCATPSAPWDAASGLPSTVTGAGPLTASMTMTNGRNYVFTDGVYNGGHVLSGLGALVGSAGEELAIAYDAHGGFNWGEAGSTPGWVGSFSIGASAPTAGVPDLAGGILTRPAPPSDTPAPPSCAAIWTRDTVPPFERVF